MAIRRMRLEYAVLLERAESQILLAAESGNTGPSETMPRPATPSFLDDTLNLKAIKNGITKAKKSKASLTLNGSGKKLLKDPELPRNPKNAFVVFCEKELEKMGGDNQRTDYEKVDPEKHKHLAGVWNNMSEEQHRVYEQMAEQDLERYQREMLAFSERKITMGQRDLLSNGRERDGEEISTLSEVHASDDPSVKRQKLDAALIGHVESSHNHVSDSNALYQGHGHNG